MANDGDGVASVHGEAYTLRSYQAEMVEASLKQNIIVAVIIPIWNLGSDLADRQKDGHRERQNAHVSPYL